MRTLSRTTITRSTASRRARNSASLRIGGRRRPASRPSRRRCRLASSRVDPLMPWISSLSLSWPRPRLPFVDDGVRRIVGRAAVVVVASAPDLRRRRRRRRRVAPSPGLLVVVAAVVVGVVGSSLGLGRRRRRRRRRTRRRRSARRDRGRGHGGRGGGVGWRPVGLVVVGRVRRVVVVDRRPRRRHRHRRRRVRRSTGCGATNSGMYAARSDSGLEDRPATRVRHRRQPRRVAASPSSTESDWVLRERGQPVRLRLGRLKLFRIGLRVGHRRPRILLKPPGASLSTRPREGFRYGPGWLLPGLLWSRSERLVGNPRCLAE